MEIDEQTQTEKIVPLLCGGRTFIYFPAEKEYSGLRFHINAPFASTVARDSIRDCKDNVKLFNELAQLLIDSLPKIKAQGLMNHSFFEALPNRKDNLSIFYNYIATPIYDNFENHEYLPGKNGGYASSRNALICPAVITNLFTASEFKALTKIKNTWILNAAQKNSLADNFIQSLGIRRYDFQDFIHIFNVPDRAQTEQFLQQKDTKWLKRFYSLCAEAYEDLAYSNKYTLSLRSSTRSTFLQSMKDTLFIRSKDGTMHRPNDIFILPPNTHLLTNSTPIVEPDLIAINDKAYTKADEIKRFFKYGLGIKDYGMKIEIEKLLEKYTDAQTIPNDYLADLLSFAKYSEMYKDIDFSTYPLFLYYDKATSSPRLTQAKDLFLGQAYGNITGEILANAYEKYHLWNGYANNYPQKELRTFINFAIYCGILQGLKIEKTDVHAHPLFISKLFSNRKVTRTEINSDYSIVGLEKLLKYDSPTINKIIWKTLLDHENSDSLPCTTAEYAPNASCTVKTCPSSLIYHLQNYAWIPDKKGILHKPEDISIDDLPDEFTFDPTNKLFEALKIGKKTTTNTALEAEVQKCGMRLISEEDFEQFQKWKAKEEKRTIAEALSVQTLLKKQTKVSRPNINAGDDFTTDGAVANTTRRMANIEKTFRNAQKMKPAHRRLFAHTTESNSQERITLSNWYHGECQMCHTRILRHDGFPHFIAKNIIDTRHLADSIRQTTNIAWNSLCLCPNCAAKYDVCTRDLNDLYEQIMSTHVVDGDVEKITLSIELNGEDQPIHYVPKHFLALKTVFQLIDKNLE